jgi:hypothetical protein
MLQLGIVDRSLKKTDLLMKNRMKICHVDLRHAQTTKTTIQDYLGGSSLQKSTPTRIITPVRVNELIPRESYCISICLE